MVPGGVKSTKEDLNNFFLPVTPHFYVLFLNVQILLFTRLLCVCYGFYVDKILIYQHKYRSDYRECILVTVHEDAGVRKRSDGLFEKDDRRQSDGKMV